MQKPLDPAGSEPSRSLVPVAPGDVAAPEIRSDAVLSEEERRRKDEEEERAAWDRLLAQVRHVQVVTSVPAPGLADSNEGDETGPRPPAADLTGDGGVLKRVLTRGSGGSPQVGATVVVEYEGCFEGGDAFDSQEDRDEKQTTLVVGQGNVLEGLDISILSMQRGEVAQFTMAPNYAYGRLGCPPRIPPDATLEYEVKLIDFVNPEKTTEKVRDRSVAERIKLGESARTEGAIKFREGVYRVALKCFNRGLDNFRMKDLALTAEQEEQIHRIKLPLLLNAAAACLKLGKSEARNALRFCEQALEIDPLCVKALYRMARAYNLLWLHGAAEEKLLRALELDASDPTLRRELQRTREAIRKEREQSSQMFRGIFTRSPNDHVQSTTTPPETTVAKK